MLGIEFQALHMQGKCGTVDLHPLPQMYTFYMKCVVDSPPQLKNECDCV